VYHISLDDVFAWFPNLRFIFSYSNNKGCLKSYGSSPFSVGKKETYTRVRDKLLLNSDSFPFYRMAVKEST
jgi:hypothetical protein